MTRHNLPSLLFATILTWSCREVNDSPGTRAAPSVREASRGSPVVDAGSKPRFSETAMDAGSGVAPFTLGLPHEHQHAVDHVVRATSLDQGGDTAGAIAELRRAVYDDPANLDALERLGRISRLAHEDRIAMAAYERLSAENPADALPEIRLARLFLVQGETAKARASAKEALQRDPSSAEAEHLLGRAELSRGKLTAAIAAFERATSLDPSHAWAFNNLGYACILANQNEKAVDALEEAVALKPEAASIWNNLGVALERLGRHQDAMGAFARSLEVNPRYSKAKINAESLAQDVALSTGAPVAGGMGATSNTTFDNATPDPRDPQPIDLVEPDP